MAIQLVPLLIQAAKARFVQEAAKRGASLLQTSRRVNKMKGWKTISVNVAAILAAVVAHIGFDLPASVWEPVVLAAGNFILRFVTSTPVFSRD